MDLARLRILIIVYKSRRLFAELLGRKIKTRGPDDVITVESPSLARDPVDFSSEKILNDERGDGALPPGGIS